MPIYMDRHDVSAAVTAEIVAQIHQEDLKIQQKYNCRGLTYWFDDVRKTAFCLIEAPDKNAIIKMHEHAHGEVPHQVIEVDETIVESFLGRIEDPQKAQNASLNIINDPAFRIIMVIDFHKNYSNNADILQTDLLFQESAVLISEMLTGFEGRVVNQTDEGFLISFKSVSKAVLCSKEIVEQIGIGDNELKISLNAGVPVTEKKSIFEDTVKLARRMNFIGCAKVVLTDEIRDLFKSENSNRFIDAPLIYVVSSSDQKFINSLIDFIESEWKNTKLKVEDFNKLLGYSKSQLYRKMMQLIGESPNSFLLTYRLNRAMELLKKENSSVSEIAYDSGFSSPSYFTKCFNKRFSLSPSEFLHKKR